MEYWLGSAQFGLNYDLSSKQRVPSEAVRSMLDRFGQNFTGIDTAFSYGNAHDVILNNWDIINRHNLLLGTKIPWNNRLQEYSRKEMLDFLVGKTNDAFHLFGDKLDYILLHDEQYLLFKSLDWVLGNFRDYLSHLDSSNNLRFGISVYDPDKLLKRRLIYFDSIQAPVNVLDRRFTTPCVEEVLHDTSTQLDARSIFLKGMLVDSELNAPTSELANARIIFWDYCRSVGVSPVSACLGFVKSIGMIKRAVVGVTSEVQLGEILESTRSSTLPSFPEISLDPKILDPRFF